MKLTSRQEKILFSPLLVGYKKPILTPVSVSYVEELRQEIEKAGQQFIIDSQKQADLSAYGFSAICEKIRCALEIKTHQLPDPTINIETRKSFKQRNKFDQLAQSKAAKGFK